MDCHDKAYYGRFLGNTRFFQLHADRHQDSTILFFHFFTIVPYRCYKTQCYILLILIFMHGCCPLSNFLHLSFSLQISFFIHFHEKGSLIIDKMQWCKVIRLRSRRSVVGSALDFESGGHGFDPRRRSVLWQDTISSAHALYDDWHTLSLVSHHWFKWEGYQLPVEMVCVLQYWLLSQEPSG